MNNERPEVDQPLGGVPKHQNVLITGGSGAIGSALVSKFANAGYSVWFTYCQSKSRAQELVNNFYNESIKKMSLIAQIYPDAFFILLGRHSTPYLNSLLSLINYSTFCKTGVDTSMLPDWQNVNL